MNNCSTQAFSRSLDLEQNVMTSPNEPPGMPFDDVTFRAKSSELEKNARVLGCVAPQK